MNYTDAFSNALEKFQDDPGSVNGPFWSMIIGWITDCIHENRDFGALVEENSNLLNLGICGEISGPAEEVYNSVFNEDLSEYPIKIYTFTTWLKQVYNRILQGDRKDVLEKEIKGAQIQRNKLKKEIESYQLDRKNKLLLVISDQINSSKISIVNELVKLDELRYSGFQMKKAISQGSFFSVQQKREHFDRESQLQKKIHWFNNFLEMQNNKTGIAEVRKIQERINTTITAIIELETTIEKLVSEMQTIEDLNAKISSAENENTVRKELEHLRDLLKLTARRLRLPACPIVKSGQELFSFQKIRQCIDRIQEFDPEIFHNNRVALSGKPDILIIPGIGSAIYDWKNNCLVVPLMIPGGNALASIAAGIIDYRIDVDEDRVLLQTYNQIAERKTIRSAVDLRLMLTKDYIAWMTSEYDGFRVLPKGVKEWFEHTIAPSRNEIYTPPEYRTSVLSSSEFNAQLNSIEEVLSGDITQLDEKVLWVGSILYYQKGRFDISLKLLQKINKRNPDFAMAWYNAGLVASKLMRKQEAITAFTEYANRFSQCWWTRIARDYLKRLQAG